MFTRLLATCPSKEIISCENGRHAKINSRSKTRRWNDLQHLNNFRRHLSWTSAGLQWRRFWLTSAQTKTHECCRSVIHLLQPSKHSVEYSAQHSPGQNMPVLLAGGKWSNFYLLKWTGSFKSNSLADEDTVTLLRKLEASRTSSESSRDSNWKF